MGQRLIMCVHDPEDSQKQVLNAYYHWGAYTSSALEIANSFIKTYDRIEKTGDFTIDCIRALERTGGRVKSEDQDYIRSLGYEPLTEDLNRDSGLIALSEKEMTELENWSEGFCDVYFEDQRVVNGCCVYFDSLESCLDWYDVTKEEEKGFIKELENYPIIDDISELHFDELEKNIAIITNIVNDGIFMCKTKDGAYITFIE